MQSSFKCFASSHTMDHHVWSFRFFSLFYTIMCGTISTFWKTIPCRSYTMSFCLGTSILTNWRLPKFSLCVRSEVLIYVANVSIGLSLAAIRELYECQQVSFYCSSAQTFLHTPWVLIQARTLRWFPSWWSKGCQLVDKGSCPALVIIVEEIIVSLISMSHLLELIEEPV